MNVEEFVDAVWETDGVRISVWAPRNTEIETPYEFTRALDGGRTVKDLRRLRIDPCLGGLEYEIQDGDFDTPNGKMKLTTLRDSYCE